MWAGSGPVVVVTAGTAVDALGAAVPQWLVPSAHDQPDNAARLTRLGVACELSTTPSEADLALAWRDTIERDAVCSALVSVRQRLAQDGDGADRVAEWVVGDAHTQPVQASAVGGRLAVDRGRLKIAGVMPGPGTWRQHHR